MKIVDVEERKRKILASIVEEYINTGSPVGSRTVSQKFRWSLSPATIRNVMADLEGEALIHQPHTSAGRVPTDKGYRYYVDNLMGFRRLTKEEEEFIIKTFRGPNIDLETILEEASKLISVLTNIVGLVMTPRLRRSSLKYIGLKPVGGSKILATLITSSGLIKNSILEIDEDLTKSELERISEFLNSELEGILLGEIKTYLTRKLLEERTPFYTLLKKAMALIIDAPFMKSDDRIFFEGISYIMQQPEFSDISKMGLLLKAIEEETNFLELLGADMEEEGVHIHIGRENPFKEIQDCSIVTCNYRIGAQAIGAVGAFGPTRMEYDRTVSVVSYISDLLGKVLSELG